MTTKAAENPFPLMVSSDLNLSNSASSTEMISGGIYNVPKKFEKTHMLLHSLRKLYLISTKSSIGRTSVIISRKDFNVIISTILLILHLKAEKAQMNIFTYRCFNYPITILFVFVVGISKSRVGKDLIDSPRGFEVTTTN